MTKKVHLPITISDFVRAALMTTLLVLSANIVAAQQTNTFPSSGNVGIGTTSPGTKLDITGSGDVRIGLDHGGTSQLFKGFSTNHSAANVPSQLNIGLLDGAFTGIVIKNFRDNSLNSQSLEFQTHHGGISAGTRMLIDKHGNVGIGTTTPGQKLSVAGTVESTVGGFRFPDGTVQTTAASGDGAGSAGNVSSGQFGLNTGGGNYSFPSQLAVDAPSGYGARLVVGQPSADYPGNTGWNSNLLLNGADSTSISFHDSLLRVDTLRVAGGTFNIGENVGWGVANTRVHGNLTVDGNIAAKYQDVAEWVPSTHALTAGTVVTLDPIKSNHVKASIESYDTRVAGVISAQPGITLGESGEGKVLVATTGRVRVKVDASRAPIQIGDLLVTSDVPGVAMKSEPVEFAGRKMHMPGTIIGKALEPLAKGHGEIRCC